MVAILMLMREQPAWAWMALAALLLAGELASGSGYLLWPSASAGLVGLLKLAGLPVNAAVQIGLFVVLTIGSTYAARRFLPHRGHSLPAADDLNDQKRLLIGREGEALSDDGGRVFVDGKEWAAELEDGGSPEPGQRVRVTAVLGGARLQVTPV